MMCTAAVNGVYKEKRGCVTRYCYVVRDRGSGLQVQVRAEVTRRIQKLGRLGRAKEAVQELAQMARLGVQPDTQAATALLDACVRAGKLDMALSVFEELFGAMPDSQVLANLRNSIRKLCSYMPPFAHICESQHCLTSCQHCLTSGFCRGCDSSERCAKCAQREFI